MRYDRLARIERLERSLAAPPASTLPLSRFEQRELLALEADRAARFPRPIDSMDLHELADFLSWSAGDGHGSAQRLDQLRQRNRGQEQIAADLAFELAIGVMDRGQLDDFMAEMALLSSEPAKGDRPCS